MPRFENGTTLTRLFPHRFILREASAPDYHGVSIRIRAL